MVLRGFGQSQEGLGRGSQWARIGRDERAIDPQTKNTVISHKTHTVRKYNKNQ